jgi:quercetin dioxygenase-like cupin family protein
MPILRGGDAPSYRFGDIDATGLSSPSRGATEITTAILTFPPGSSVPPHTHDHEEILHVLSGRLRFMLEDEETVLEPGDSAIVPAGSTHSPGASDQGEVRILSATPVGTLRIQADGERALPPWGD